MATSEIDDDKTPQTAASEQGHDWNMFQSWRDVLFAHWRIDPDQLRPVVPAQMDIDVFDGSAWLSMVPMRMADLHFRDLPPLPGLMHFLEINFRAYVTVHGMPGVYFFSIDCDDSLADIYAHHFLHLPMARAKMEMKNVDGVCYYDSHRKQESGLAPAALVASYKPIGDPYNAEPGSLEQFLLERYSMFFNQPDGSILHGRMEHAPWQIWKAEATIEENTIGQASGFDIKPYPDYLHYAERADTHAWPVLKM